MLKNHGQNRQEIIIITFIEKPQTSRRGFFVFYIQVPPFFIR